MKYILSAVVNIALCFILVLKPFILKLDMYNSGFLYIILFISSIISIVGIMISVKFIFTYIRNENTNDLVLISKSFETLKWNIILNLLLIFTLELILGLIGLIIMAIGIAIFGLRV